MFIQLQTKKTFRLSYVSAILLCTKDNILTEFGKQGN